MTFSFNVKGITPDDVNIGGGGTQIIETLSPTNCAGLCFWIDGQCNTRQVNDHTKTYLENLVWNIPLTQSNGNLEYLNNGTDNAWVGDFLKLGNYAYYPYVYNTDLTIEAVLKLDSDAEGVTQSIVSTANTSGFMLSTEANTHKVKLQARVDNEYKILLTEEGLEYDNIYYIVATIKSNDKISLRINDNAALTADFGGNLVSKAGVNMGIGTNSNTSTNMNVQLWNGLNLGMVRIWNRILTNIEIQQNYTDIKRRFNF